ncbi:MAG: sulfurtransferase TusA family protein [Methanomassiliicoccales archaeon]|nr:MAG: sulfurtransferase TusA family protein [Methanomassiliicoccales archaeon]
MTERIDVRGLSCPQPLVLTRKKMKELGAGTFEVIGDSATARDNIYRLAREKAWDIKEERKEDEFILILSKSKDI